MNTSSSIDIPDGIDTSVPLLIDTTSYEEVSRADDHVLRSQIYIFSFGILVGQFLYLSVLVASETMVSIACLSEPTTNVLVMLAGSFIAWIAIYLLTDKGSNAVTQLLNDNFSGSEETPWTSRSSFIAVILFQGGLLFGTIFMASGVDYFNGVLSLESFLFASFMDLSICLCIICFFNLLASEDDEDGDSEEEEEEQNIASTTQRQARSEHYYVAVV